MTRLNRICWPEESSRIFSSESGVALNVLNIFSNLYIELSPTGIVSFIRVKYLSSYVVLTANILFMLHAGT